MDNTKICKGHSFPGAFLVLGPVLYRDFGYWCNTVSDKDIRAVPPKGCQFTRCRWKKSDGKRVFQASKCLIPPFRAKSVHLSVNLPTWHGSSPCLTRIFTERHVPPPMQAIFNGIITNDKFCLSRIRHLPKMPARKGFAQEIQYPSEATEQVCCPKVEIDEKTTVEHAALHNSGSRCTASLGSSLSTAAPMERTNRIPLPHRVTSTGESR